MQGIAKEVEVKKSAADKPYLEIKLDNDLIYRFWNEEDYKKEIAPGNSIQFTNTLYKNFNNGSKLVVLNQSSNSAASNNQDDLIIVLNKINDSLIQLALQMKPISEFFKKLHGGN